MTIVIGGSQILAKLNTIISLIQGEQKQMATIAQALSDVLKSTSDIVSAASTEIELTNQIITALKAIPAGSTITQDQINQLETASQSLESAASNLGTASTAMQGALAPPPAPAPAPLAPPAGA